MNEQEEKIIAMINDILEAKEESSYHVRTKSSEVMDYLSSCFTMQNFGSDGSEDFILHPSLTAFFKKITDPFIINDFIKLRFQIEKYLILTKNNDAAKQDALLDIEITLQDAVPDAKAAEMGTGMWPAKIANADFMRELYSLNDDGLSKLFSRYLPIPKASVFANRPLPPLIAQREKDSTQAISNLLARNDNNVSLVESTAIKLQRKFRAKRKKQEDMHRLPHRYFKKSPEEAKQLWHAANEPYTPQCDPALAERIMRAAGKITLFTKVMHLTAPAAFASIFEDGLHGRRTMQQFYMPFKEAALGFCDIQDGDANVVCLGAQGIDPRSAHGALLEFDANKLAQDNPCVFYKQRDLGYYLDEVRTVSIGIRDIHFCHTSANKRAFEDDTRAPFHLLHSRIDPQDIRAYATVEKALLISNNFAETHKILALNFFRFIDGLHRGDEKCTPDNSSKESIYEALALLDDEELATVLHDIGQQMTDTMEFNIYGVCKIDFSALSKIAIKGYTLDFPAFVNALKEGNLAKLVEAEEKIPQIFASARFLDYLLANTQDETVVAALIKLKEKCVIPAWKELAAAEEKKSDDEEKEFTKYYGPMIAALPTADCKKMLDRLRENKPVPNLPDQKMDPDLSIKALKLRLLQEECEKYKNHLEEIKANHSPAANSASSLQYLTGKIIVLTKLLTILQNPKDSFSAKLDKFHKTFNKRRQALEVRRYEWDKAGKFFVKATASIMSLFIAAPSLWSVGGRKVVSAVDAILQPGRRNRAQK